MRHNRASAAGNCGNERGQSEHVGRDPRSVRVRVRVCVCVCVCVRVHADCVYFHSEKWNRLKYTKKPAGLCKDWRGRILSELPWRSGPWLSEPLWLRQKWGRVTSRATFLISLVSMQRSILRTVEMSMCSLEMELSHVVKLSTVARNRTQVNFKILKILLMMLSRRKKRTWFKQTSCPQSWCCVWNSGVLPKTALSGFVLDPDMKRQGSGGRGWAQAWKWWAGFSIPAVAAPKPNSDRIVNLWSKLQSKQVHIERYQVWLEVQSALKGICYWPETVCICPRNWFH